MTPGKLTIQAWHEEQSRIEAAAAERARKLNELGREIEALLNPRRRRRPGLGDRIARFLVG
jgi:chromosome segregation ATPase